MAEYNEQYLMLLYLHRRQQAKHAARRKRRGPKVTKRIRQAVIDRDGLVCGICGLAVEHVSGVHIDHIRPATAGGSNSLDNLQVAHALCNQKKGAKV